MTQDKALLLISSCLWGGRDVLCENKGSEGPDEIKATKALMSRREGVSMEGL